MVEGGRIDNAHHAGNAARALEETDAFDAAIATALEMTDATETLIIVTADHSHTLIMSGYPARNNPVLGLVADGEGEPAIARDGKPYTALGYANGPGATDAVRSDLSGTDTQSVDYLQQALVPLGAETHAGDDVAIFARGPYAHLFQGVVDQQLVYHVMAYASGIPAKAGLK
jgi:alkaline phosphatase